MIVETQHIASLFLCGTPVRRNIFRLYGEINFAI